MILPLFLHHPPSQPFSSPPSSSPSWASAAFLTVNAEVPSDLSTPVSSAASIRRLDCREARCSVQAFLIHSGARRLVFAAASLFSQHPKGPSVRCSPDMAHSHKRLCKALEVSNCRSRVSGSSCKQGFDPKFRVSAFTGHGQPELSGAELEQTDDDGSHMQVRCSNVKAPGKRKSAKELHFEAIEEYCLRYENEDIDCHETDAAPSKDMHSPVFAHTSTFEVDAVNTPINESKYLDASGVLPWHNDGGSLLTQLNGCKEKTINPSFEIEKRRMSDKMPQSSTKANVNGVEGSKNIYMNTAIAQRTEAPRDEGSVQKLIRRETVAARRLDSYQRRNKLDEEEDLQSEKCPNRNKLGEEEEKALHTEKCQSQNTEFKPKMGNTNSDETCDLSEEQKVRMELNKAAALARRNMRSCEDAVAEAQAKGLPFPKFESLLAEKSWAEALGTEFQKPYMERLYQFVSQEAAGRIPIYPPPAKLFNAFNSCPLDKVKLVIIGQDPYHGPGQAMGLCFSVEKGIKIPSSLTNIFLEIQSDLDCDFPAHGNLEKWAHQGVLLLNTVLTVRDRHANSHAKKGWELFTDAAIRTLAQQRSGVVFLLWGNQAQEKLRLINKTSHHILKAFHPSGISAHRGFFKCRHFSKANKLLVEEGLLPIDWQL